MHTLKYLAVLTLGLIIGFFASVYYLTLKMDETKASVEKMNLLVLSTVSEQRAMQAKATIKLLEEILVETEQQYRNSSTVEEVLVSVAEKLNKKLEEIESLKEFHEFEEADLDTYSELKKRVSDTIAWYK